MTEKERELHEELRKTLPPITPWDVKDALQLHHDRLNKLGEYFITVREDLKEIFKNIEVIGSRINNGLSPSVNEVKLSIQNMRELLIKLENKMDLLFSEVDKRVSIIDTTINNKFHDFDDVMSNARSFLWKLAFTAVIAFVGMVFGIAYYVNTLKETLVIPHVQLDATMWKTLRSKH